MTKPLTNKDFDDSATFHKDFAQMQAKDFERRIKILSDALKVLSQQRINEQGAYTAEPGAKITEIADLGLFAQQALKDAGIE